MQTRKIKKKLALEAIINHKAGFIFIEATFAILIMSIVLLFAIRGLSNVLSYTNHSKSVIEATILSKKILFNIQDKKFDFEQGESSGQFEENKKFSWNLKKINSEDNEHLAEYKYWISWIEKGREQKLEFTTYEAIL